jgi:hypothetical protein
VAGFAAAWVLAARNRDLLDLRAEFGPDRFLVGYAVIGAVLASRRQSNPIGWLLLGIGLASAARAVAGQYVLYALTGSSRPRRRCGQRGMSTGRLPCCSPAAC